MASGRAGAAGELDFDVWQGHHRDGHREVPSTMTNQRTERLRPGSAPGRRGSGYRRGATTLLWLVALLAGVSQAWAAEVVEVRVGRHPDFTRIVFELDRAAGYRIERSDPSAKNSELIVSLEATSIPRRIQSSKSFIEQVVVEPSGSRSVARIRLARGGLKLKEMILASPPRIVLDVISEKDLPARQTASSATTASPTRTVAATTPKPTPSPSTVVAKTEAPARPGAAAKPAMPTSAPTSAPISAPISKPTATAATSPATRLLATTEKSDVSKSQATSPSPAPMPSTTTPTPSAAAGSDPLAAKPGLDVLAAKPEGDSDAAPGEWNDSAANGGAADANAGAAHDDAGALADAGASPDSAAASAKARPMMVKSSGDDEGGGFMTWTLAGVGLALVAFVGLVVARRRRAVADVDGGMDEPAMSPFDDEEQDAKPSTSETSNPFAALSGAGSAPAPAAAASTFTPSRAADKKQDQKPESSLFDDTEEKTMESMEVISRSQVNESLGGPPMMGGASDEIQQMFREMQRRVAALEGRIDELVDARDRLERQVAAQTEELRVQRAAIARTQRAVRNLARPEDAGDDEPTEPALRDPN